MIVTQEFKADIAQHIYKQGSLNDWDSARLAAVGTIGTDSRWRIGAKKAASGSFTATIHRGFLLFDTSGIWPGTVVGARIAFDSMPDSNEDDAGYATLHVVEGVHTDPLKGSDFGGLLAKTTSGGSATITELLADPTIELNAKGLLWLTGSSVALGLRVAADLSDTPPVADNAEDFLEFSESFDVTVLAVDIRIPDTDTPGHPTLISHPSHRLFESLRVPSSAMEAVLGGSMPTIPVPNVKVRPRR